MSLIAVDVMGFAGSMAAGVDQAGWDIIAKKEPSAFKGFGVESFTYNMPWVEAQVSDWGTWDLPAEQPQMIFGCPPCSGFSQLSHANTIIHGATYGAAAPINECMVHFIEYAARVKPRIMVMESVGAAFRGDGRAWMEGLFDKLLAESGLPYQLYHVNHDSMMIGGDVRRPRYFFVASLDPFGVGLEYVTPRTVDELIGDLPYEEEGDTDWGHVHRSKGRRSEMVMKWLREQGREWRAGTRLPENVEGLEPPDFMMKPEGSKRSTRLDESQPNTYSDWFSTDPFSAARWRGDKPFGVVVGASLDRAIHPHYDRTFSYREIARFMSLPDNWSLRVIVEGQKNGEMGKAVTSAAGKWIGHWARMAVEGTPGEYAGRETDRADIRVITVNTPKAVDEILRGNPDDVFWPDEMTSDPDPAVWIIDRKARPDEWWQREDELGIFLPKANAPKKARTLRGTPGATKSPPARVVVDRVDSDRVAALLAELGLTKAAAAEKLGVSLSRIAEISTPNNPKRWLAADRWDHIEGLLRG